MANTKPIGVAYEDQDIIGATTVSATNILSTGAIGYAAGAYGNVTQQNNKTTAVTVNASSGQIITANSQLAPSANALFKVNNNVVSSKDVVIVSPATGGTNGAYNVTNNAYSESIRLNFAILHTVT
jgi:deoxycytidylate deaminase